MHLADHPTDTGVIFMLNCLLKLAETQSLNGSFLVFWVADSAFHIFDTKFCHCFLLSTTATRTFTALWAVTAFTAFATLAALSVP